MFVHQIAKKHLPFWNSHVYSAGDFFTICKNLKIIYVETDLIAGAGEYRMYRGKPFVIVNPFCDARYKLWIWYHELAHHFCSHALGTFDTRTTRKLDWEANVISTVALIPNRLLFGYHFAEIIEFYDYPHELLVTRLKVFERLGL